MIEPVGCGLDSGQADFARGVRGKLLSLQRRRRCDFHLKGELGVSERRACRLVSRPRSTQRLISKRTEAEEKLREKIVELAKWYGRYGHRRITALLQREALLAGDNVVDSGFFSAYDGA